MSPIIPVSGDECQARSWKNLLKTAVSDPRELLERVGVKSEDLHFKVSLDNDFATRVPQPFIDKMQFGDPSDPLLLQVLSQQKETLKVEGYKKDPLEETNSQLPGVLHKYRGRVLLILASACAVNCRYCFRRHFPYQDKLAQGEQLQSSLTYIENDPSISEVILSGGDPLIVSDQTFEWLISKLEAIPHLKRLRIHSRLPVVIPQRITEKICRLFADTRLNTSMVLHINHANEIDQRLAQSLKQLQLAEVTLFNQSVLLKDINDSAEVLAQLSEKLFTVGVVPYYLHCLDKVAGAAHFDIPIDKAKHIVSKLRDRLPGYLVPRLAIEKPGEGSKSIIA